ncbi:MAG: hypothetical protein ACXVYM_04675 [Gaiellaceae bacterium]
MPGKRQRQDEARCPVRAFLETQGRFSHLSSDAIDSIQAHIDERWDLIAGLASEG